MLVGITGGLGVIGQALTETLQRNGARFVVLDHSKPGNSFGDINNRDDLDEFFYRCDGIVHLAGISSVEAGEADTQACYKTNVLGTLNVIDFVSRFNPPKWLFFASSRAVYGTQKKYPVSEQAKCSPINQYGISKLLAEELIQSKCKRLNVPFAILRLSNVYGSRNDIPSRVIPMFFQNAIKGDALVCFGNTTTCDFVHIQDVIASIIATTQKLQNNQTLPTLNICSGEETRLIELANSILKITSSKSILNVLPKKAHHVERFVGSNARAFNHLGWSPKIKLDEGLEMFFDTMRRNGQ